MKKIKILGVIFAVILIIILAGMALLFVRDSIGTAKADIESDARSSQRIDDSWLAEKTVSDTMAALIFYPENKSANQANHVFSVYVNRPGLSFGYFFQAGGSAGIVEDGIGEFSAEGCGERAYISMNKAGVERLDIMDNDGNSVQVVAIDGKKPFAFVLPVGAGTAVFYDADGNVVETHKL